MIEHMLRSVGYVLVAATNVNAIFGDQASDHSVIRWPKTSLSQRTMGETIEKEQRRYVFGLSGLPALRLPSICWLIT